MFHINSYTYDSSDVLGRGTFSTVYKAYRNNVKYAIKKIDNKIKEIDNEVQIHSRLKHPNIVEFIDVIYKDQYTYIISEFCGNETLRSYIERLAPLEESEIINILQQLSSAIKYLYDRNIMHRDLKPENILLQILPYNDKKIIKLTDFSFATEFYDDSTIFSEICGSPAYMAPEIRGNHVYNNRSDLWSIGMIIHQMKYGLLKKTSIRSKYSKNELEIIMYSLLEENPYKRISWKEFFENELIRECNISSDSDSDVLEEKINEEYCDDFEDIFIMNLVKSKPINIKSSKSIMATNAI